MVIKRGVKWYKRYFYVEVTTFFGYYSLRKVKALGAKFVRSNKAIKRYRKTVRVSLVNHRPLIYFVGDDNLCFNFFVGDVVFDAFIGAAKIDYIYLNKHGKGVVGRLKKKKRMYDKWFK